LDRQRIHWFEVRENFEALAPECKLLLCQVQTVKCDPAGPDSFENTRLRFKFIWKFRSEWIGAEGIDFNDVLQKMGILDPTFMGAEHPLFFFHPHVIRYQ